MRYNLSKIPDIDELKVNDKQKTKINIPKIIPLKYKIILAK